MSTPCYMQIMNHNPIVVNILVTSVVPLVSQQVKLITQPQNNKKQLTKTHNSPKSYKNENYFQSNTYILYFVTFSDTDTAVDHFTCRDSCSYKYLFIVRSIFETYKKKEFIAFSHLYGSFKYYDFFLCVSRGS